MNFHELVFRIKANKKLVQISAIRGELFHFIYMNLQGFENLAGRKKLCTFEPLQL